MMYELLILLMLLILLTLLIPSILLIPVSQISAYKTVKKLFVQVKFHFYLNHGREVALLDGKSNVWHAPAMYSFTQGASLYLYMVSCTHFNRNIHAYTVCTNTI